MVLTQDDHFRSRILHSFKVCIYEFLDYFRKNTGIFGYSWSDNKVMEICIVRNFCLAQFNSRLIYICLENIKMVMLG